LFVDIDCQFVILSTYYCM